MIASYFSAVRRMTAKLDELIGYLLVIMAFLYAMSGHRRDNDFLQMNGLSDDEISRITINFLRH